MVKTILSDFSRVILFPKDDEYLGRLGSLYKQHQSDQAFSFADLFEFNEELLKFYSKLHKNYGLDLLTESVGIVKMPEVKDRLAQVFDRIFTPADTGLSKTDPRAYMDIARILGQDTSQILFIDDRTANLDAAQKAGLQVLQYFSNSRLFDDLDVHYRIKPED